MIAWVVVIGVLVVYWHYHSSAASITSQARANLQAATNPALLQTVNQNNNALNQQVQVDIATGNTVVKSLATSAGAGIGAAGASIAGSTTFIGLSATAWTGVGAAVAGIFILINALRSDAHLYANELVQKYENPFGKYIIQLYQAVQAGITSMGTLSSADAAALTNAAVQAWAQYQVAMANFQSRGGEWNLVATQSLQNLDSAQGMGGAFNLNPALPKTALGNGWMTAVVQQMTAWTTQIQSAGY